MATVQELLRSASELPIESARRDTEILLSHCLGKPRTWLYTWPEREVTAAEAHNFAALLSRRQAGVPIAYLTGEKAFWTLQLSVNSATLIPRPETETLVAWALELSLPSDATVLDLGTGSGAIALAVASERPGWQVTAVDSSAEALAVARSNGVTADLHNVRFLQSNWYSALSAMRFHLLLGNPPYIDGQDTHLERGDLRFEPRSALVAADAGLGDLSRLAANAGSHLVAGGWLLLEHGFEQGAAVRAMLAAAGFNQVSTRLDIAGQERITGGCWSAE